MITIREIEEEQIKEKALVTNSIKCDRCKLIKKDRQRNFIFQWTLTFFFFSIPLITVAFLTSTDLLFESGFGGILITVLILTLIISGGYLFLLNQEDDDE